MMKYFILIGSPRENSESAKVADYVQKVILTRCADNQVHRLSLASNPFPLWDESFPASAAPWASSWSEHSAALSGSDAVIFITPEWGGMAPAGVKNFFLLCDRGQLAHKPALIVAVSSGRGGSYPVAELRMSSYKNTRVCYIPEHVIVHHVRNVLNTEDPSSEADKLIRRRIAFGVGILEAYALGLAQVRTHSTVIANEFQSGM